MSPMSVFVVLVLSILLAIFTAIAVTSLFSYLLVTFSKMRGAK